MRRRALLSHGAVLGASATVLAILDACEVSAPAPGPRADTPLETTKLRVAKVSSICLGAQYVAEDLLRDEGFTDLEYVSISGQLIAPRVASGDIDLSMQFSGPFLIRVDAGDPIVLLAGGHVGCFELFGSSRVQTIGDLKGRTVAVSGLGAPDHVFLSSIVAYIGMDPQKDINWTTVPDLEAQNLLAEDKIDALLGFPPRSQELRAKKIGHVVLNSMMDKPWSQYFCCMVGVNRSYLQKYPSATKRALRAILRAADICAREPERAARLLVDRGYTASYDYALQTMQEVPYNLWRTYDPEDTLRFYALQLHEAGMIRRTPDKIIADGTDWRFLRELKREL